MINKYFNNNHIITIIDLENEFEELHSFKPDDFIEKYEYNLFKKSRMPKYFKYSKVINNIIYIKKDYYKTRNLGAIVYKKIPKNMNEIINKSDSVRYRAPDFTKRFFLNRKGLEYFLKNFNFEILENSQIIKNVYIDFIELGIITYDNNEYILTFEKKDKLYAKEELLEDGEPSSKGKFDTLKDLYINEKGGRKYDRNKPDWSLLNLKTLRPMIKVLDIGAKKYSRHNWKKVEPHRIYRALIKHISEWQSGEIIDSDSGESHLTHAMCNLYFLMWMEQNNKLTPEEVVNGKNE